MLNKEYIFKLAQAEASFEKNRTNYNISPSWENLTGFAMWYSNLGEFETGGDKIAHHNTK